jgi:hypothetical protein
LEVNVPGEASLSWGPQAFREQSSLARTLFANLPTEFDGPVENPLLELVGMSRAARIAFPILCIELSASLDISPESDSFGQPAK